jgi:hypothetical protein
MYGPAMINGYGISWVLANEGTLRGRVGHKRGVPDDPFAAGDIRGHKKTHGAAMGSPRLDRRSGVGAQNLEPTYLPLLMGQNS